MNLVSVISKGEITGKCRGKQVIYEGMNKTGEITEP